MVARPSLKRVVPGSVPPWRALCAESARALKAVFSVLCVSKSVFQVRADIARAKLARFLGQALVPARGPRARRGPAAASVALQSSLTTGLSNKLRRAGGRGCHKERPGRRGPEAVQLQHHGGHERFHRLGQQRHAGHGGRQLSGRASAGCPGLVSSCARVFFVAASLFRAAATSTSGNQERAAAFRQHYA